MRDTRKSYDWEKLLAHAAILQGKIPAAVLVGGTAAALHAGHRVSFDHDHVLKDLAVNYDKVVSALESIAGWRTNRRVRGKLILGEIEDIPAGLRNQRRSAPLETTTVRLPGGRTLNVPTLEETLRIKAFLIVERNATRDYLDVAALSHHLGTAQSVLAIEKMRDLYAQFAGEVGDIMVSIVVKLTAPDPYDLTEVDLKEYKGIIPPWDDWAAVERQCRSLAEGILRKEPPGANSTPGA
jgi:hypothetical protein